MSKKKKEQIVANSDNSAEYATVEPEPVLHDYGDDFPILLELDENFDFRSLGLYEYRESGIYFSGGQKIICVTLLDKSK